MTARKTRRAIQRCARRELRRSPELWKEYNAKRKLYRSQWAAQFTPVILLFPALSRLTDPESHPGLFAALCLYCMGTVMSLAQELLTGLHASPDFSASLFLPISEKEFFDRQARKAVFASWPVLLFSTVGFYFFAAVKRPARDSLLVTAAPGDAAIAILAAVLIWLVTLSLAVHLAHFRPQWIHGYVQLGVMLLACVAIFVPAAIGEPLHTAMLVTPMGWVTHSVHAAFAPLRLPFFWAWIPALGVAVALPRALTHMREHYRIVEVFFGPPELSTADLGPDFDPSAAGDNAEQGLEMAEARRRFMPSKMSNRLRDEGLPRGLNWEMFGWVERFVGSHLSEREKTIAEYMLAGALGWWTWWWTRATAVLLFTALLAVMPIPVPTWVFFVALIGVPLLATPWAGGQWPGFERHLTAEQLVPCHAYYPIGFRETSWMTWKVNWARFALLLPAFLLACAAVDWRMGGNGWAGAWNGLQAFFLLAAVQPFFSLATYSTATNDTRQIHFENFLVIGALLPMGLAYVVACFGFFMATGQWQVVCAAVVLGFPVLGWWLYGWLYDRGRVDTIRPPDA